MRVEDEKLKKLFQFLANNRAWNEQFQREHYRRNLLHCKGPLERLTALLHSTVNSQSRPKLDLLGQFWRHFNTFSTQGRLTLDDLCRHLEAGLSKTLLSAHEGPWHRLYLALKASPGWGDKTAALFVKNVINVHRGPKELHFLSDVQVRKPIDPSDKVFLPVDTVIIHIFRCLGTGSATFTSVNDLLMDRYQSPDDILVWDDLWYWGFFSQTSVKDGDGSSAKLTRQLKWNESKFWCQVATPKDKIVEVKRLVKKFISLC